ncbi:MAG TPA: hypothetical protein VF897_18765, partial [Roseiflexaceae bacterium]
MSLSVAAPPMSLVQRYWRDRALWTTIADVFAILAALALPWSTTLVAIFVPCWLGALAWVMDWRAYGRLLKKPICYFPLALVGLALVGTLWSDAAWGARLYAIGPTLKLLVQWGMTGVLLLYAMWLVHLLLFCGEGFVAWLGIL